MRVFKPKLFLPSDPVSLGSDFNFYEHDFDKFGSNVSIANYLSDFRTNFSFTDIWRKLHPRLRDVSWFYSDFNSGSRLNKFFISRNVVNVISSRVLSPCCFSDHDYLHLHVKLDKVMPCGPGLWKFNNSLLSDSFFCDFISACISDLSDGTLHFSSMKTWWDFFKESLKQDIILFAKNKHLMSVLF